ncbi:MAG: nucleotidyltransferase domain-containing protein [Promethearchaeota archaeon]
MNQKIAEKSIGNQGTGNSICPLLKIKHLPIYSQKFIQETIESTELVLGPSCIEGVILFGSLSYGKITKMSDVDLLIIVSDAISLARIRRLHQILHAIEVKHNLATEIETRSDRLQHIIESKTGMYCSHFICRLEDWKQNNFARILSLNKTFVWLLAPSKIVLDSLKHGATIVYGNGNVAINYSQYSYSHLQILKSLILTLVMAFGTILLLPINKKYHKYLLEAYKWSLRANYFYLFHRTNRLSEILSFFGRMGLSNYYLKWFNFCRITSGFHIRFTLQMPFRIMKMHLLSMRLKKIINLL